MFSYLIFVGSPARSASGPHGVPKGSFRGPWVTQGPLRGPGAHWGSRAPLIRMDGATFLGPWRTKGLGSQGSNFASANYSNFKPWGPQQRWRTEKLEPWGPPRVSIIQNLEPSGTRRRKSRLRPCTRALAHKRLEPCERKPRWMVNYPQVAKHRHFCNKITIRITMTNPWKF